MAKTPAPTLPCKECGYVNEPERVYCHNCGQKLDRSVLPKENEVRRESPDKAQRRIKKMTNPGANPAAREAKALAKTLLWAAVAAAVIQMAKEPSDVPGKSNELTTRLVSSELVQLMESPVPRALAFSEADLNQMLKQQVKAKDSGVVPGVKFERAYARLLPGEVRIGVEQSLWSYPLHSNIGIRPDYRDGVFSPAVVSGSIGRLPVHPELMKYVSYAFPFRKLWTAMKREKDQLEKMREIRVEQGRVTLVSRGQSAAPR